MRKAYELAIANSWNEIRLAVKKALAVQPPKPMSKKILWVDDECSILEGLSRVFGAENYEVVLAKDGEDAVERLGAGPMTTTLDPVAKSLEEKLCASTFLCPDP